MSTICSTPNINVTVSYDTCKKSATKIINSGDVVKIKTKKGCCFANVYWDVTSDTTNLPYTVVSSPLSGTEFKCGLTPVTIILRDNNGCFNIFVFTVKIKKC